MSHGQWIREFTHVIQALAEQSIGFPSQRSMLAVLNNCEFHQFGVAVRPAALAQRAACFREAISVALATSEDSSSKHWRCPYDIQGLIERLPSCSVCYHTRVDANTVRDGALTKMQEQMEPTKKSEKDGNVGEGTASAGTGVEELYFAREDDEYAGLPMA